MRPWILLERCLPDQRAIGDHRRRGHHTPDRGRKIAATFSSIG